MLNKEQKNLLRRKSEKEHGTTITDHELALANLTSDLLVVKLRGWPKDAGHPFNSGLKPRTSSRVQELSERLENETDEQWAARMVKEEQTRQKRNSKPSRRGIF